MLHCDATSTSTCFLLKVSFDEIVGFSFFPSLFQNSDRQLEKHKIKINDNENDNVLKDEDENLLVIIMLRTTQSKKVF